MTEVLQYNQTHLSVSQDLGNEVVLLEKRQMEVKLQVKVGHGAAIHDAAVALATTTPGGGGGARVRLADRDKGLAPGQFAAFYDGEVCLGSGVITDEGL